MRGPASDRTRSAIIQLLIAHAERMRYRIAVLDIAATARTIAEVRALRAQLDSKYAALYYPWVTRARPVTQQRDLRCRRAASSPASTPATTSSARSTRRRPTRSSTWRIGFETTAQQGPAGGAQPRGHQLLPLLRGPRHTGCGARARSAPTPSGSTSTCAATSPTSSARSTTARSGRCSSPTASALWANVRRTIEDFLLNEWQTGALLGDKPEKAYFVKCDRSTMTQNDLDNGRLVCLIGVAALQPAEFVIFRIGQWTADRKS